MVCKEEERKQSLLLKRFFKNYTGTHTRETLLLFIILFMTGVTTHNVKQVPVK